MVVLLLGAGSVAVKFCMGLFLEGDYVVKLPGQQSPVLYQKPVTPTAAATEPAQTLPGAIVETGRATLAFTGDLMAHTPLIKSATVKGGGSFEYMFSHISPYIAKADYAAVNLETTFSGTENGRTYTGSPYFNTPDTLADGAKAAGFDLMLTANNHCIDYGTFGLKRTLDILKTRGFDTLGTTSTPEEARFIIKDLGGIKVGLIAYTAAAIGDNPYQPTINGLTADNNAVGLVNAFDYRKLDVFYSQMAEQIGAMKEAGAEAIVVYLHWGNDYSVRLSDYQTAMAQKLCDLGVDVITGSHPHAVQPVVMLTSANEPTHKTVCLYSAGTFLSNLRATNISMTEGHSEDSVLFSFTFAKYSNGGVYLDGIQLLPAWVLIRGAGDDRSYHVLPLDYEAGDWKTIYAINEEQLAAARNSYNRTMEQLGSQRQEILDTLAKQKEARLEAFANGTEP